MAAAAAVVVIGVTGIALANNSDEDETPLASVAPTTNVAPTTTVAPAMKTIRFGVTSANIPVTFSVPEDWEVQDDWSAYTENIGVLFDDVSNIYSDGCQWVLADPPVGPTVDDLVSAWANHPELAATEAVDVTIDGYAGKYIEFDVPDYEPGECRGLDGGQFGLWQVQGDTGDSPAYSAVPNQHEQAWVLDVDGTRLVIGSGTFSGTTPQDRAVMEEVLASIQIG
jgi:hypothetical protein